MNILKKLKLPEFKKILNKCVVFNDNNIDVNTYMLELLIMEGLNKDKDKD